MPQGGELGEQPLAELHATVVERDGDLHAAKATPSRSHRIAFPNLSDGKAFAMTTNDAERWRELGQQLRVDSVRASAAAKLRPPNVFHVRGRSHGRPRGQIPSLRLRRTRRSTKRSPDLLQGPRVAARLLPLQGVRGDHRRGAPHLPQARQPARGTPDPAHPVGRRRDRIARPGPADRRRGRARRRSASTGFRTACGCSAATARWPRAPCGRRSSTPRSTSSTT